MTKLVRNHSHWGAFLAEVEDGRVVGVRPFERDPGSIALDRSGAGGRAFADPHCAADGARGLAAHGPGHGEGRGREPFVPVSWERALDLVAGELLRVKRDHGHDAIMAGSQGWGSAGIFHEARGQLRRFMATFGGFVDQTSNYSFGTALVFLPHVLGSAQAVHRAAHVMVVDRAPRQADGDVRRRQSEEHAGDQGRLRRAFQRPARSPNWRAPASRSSTSARSARMDRPRSRRNGSRSGPAPTPRCCWR